MFVSTTRFSTIAYPRQRVAADQNNIRFSKGMPAAVSQVPQVPQPGIRLDTRYADAAVVGPKVGFDLQKAFEQFGPQIRDSIIRLYADKDKPGAWRRWVNLGYDDKLCREIAQYAQSVKGKFTDVVVLGIGGSSLGGYALLKALRHPYWNNLPDAKRQGYPRFHFLENVDSDQIAGLLDTLDPKTTLVNVITKSGTTPETMSAFLLFKRHLEQALGKDAAKNHMVVTTDKQKGILREIARQEQYASFEVPDDVGGRFSVFSAVGLLPAALCGVNIAEIQRGIQDMDKVLQNPDVRQNPAAQNALIQYLAYQRGQKISVFMPYFYQLAPVADWYVQLWAESLGKKHNTAGEVVNVGPTPVRAVGATDQHSQVQLFNEGPFDKIVTFVNVENPQHSVEIPNLYPDSKDLAYFGNKTFHQLLTAEFESTRAALARNGRPSVTLSMPRLNPYHFGQLLYLLQVQAAITGDLLGIDTFNQPGVEQGKLYTRALMGEKALAHLVPEARGEKLSTSS